jgi:hypothetical protein
MSTTLAVLNPSTVKFTATGLHVTGKLSLDEWEAIAPELGRAHKTMSFAIGDWLCYGESHFEYQNPELPGEELQQCRELTPRTRIPGEMMRRASLLTGLDVRTLQTYAMVSRQVSDDVRAPEILDHEHHRIVAHLSPEKQMEWLSIASEKRYSSRRLRRCVQFDKILTDEELEQASTADTSVTTHVSGIKDILQWWKGVDWMELDESQRETIRADFERVRAAMEAILGPMGGAKQG